MSSRAWPVILLCLVCGTAFADTLVMKSGENKKGKILEETEKTVLFNSQADGQVVEVPKDSVAIVDRDVPSEASTSKGAVQIFSVAPKKKGHWITPRPKKEGEAAGFEAPAETPSLPSLKLDNSSQAATFQSFVKLIEDWVRSHPEAEKYIQEWMEKFKGNQDEVSKLSKIAQDAAS